MAYHYEYPRPAVSADIVVLRGTRRKCDVLLIKRRKDPYANSWALPGGFLDMDETIEETAARELKEETNLTARQLQQLKVFSAVRRDPRGRVISVAFLARSVEGQARAGDDAGELQWFAVNELPPLAFDHDRIIALALESM